MTRRILAAWSVVLGALLGVPLRGGVVAVEGREFTIPDGYQLEPVAGPPLTERPIVVDMDEQGRLYVAESSGTNDDVQTQLEERPHAILQLTDVDGDGRFDRRSVFASGMMFPVGAMWLDGSLYVAAPPQIWKLTDADDDGVAETREVWFDGETLTGCANDLHGPYAGPDGWIYWCKGAFAEQTHALPGEQTLITRAAHIFRRRPEGGPIEAVMTGGMDNPVEVAFSPGGERFFTTTFLQHPGGGLRDGLIHAIYGGVYGKRHGVLDGHPRTGDLMPVMTHLGPAAPSGLTRLESDALGFQDQLVAACFNLHHVSRHELVPQGATFITNDVVLVSSDELDFHPTDVMEDADGSLLIVDTGGWYKLCCPSSQLHKPDVLGAIYRLSKQEAAAVKDPRGMRIDWEAANASELAGRLADERPVVRRRAIAELAKRGPAAISSLQATLNESQEVAARLGAVWAACRIDDADARIAVRAALDDSDETVRQAAAHATSLWRDAAAVTPLLELLQSESRHNRRVAAEALGRIGSREAIPGLLAAIDQDVDRVLEHSLLFALAEIGSPEELRVALAGENPAHRRAAVIALQAMRSDGLRREELGELLASDDSELVELAIGVAAGRPEWGDAFADALRRRMARPRRGASEQQAFAALVARLAGSEPVRSLAAEVLASNESERDLRLSLLEQLQVPLAASETGSAALRDLLGNDDAELVAATVRYLARSASPVDEALGGLLQAVAKSTAFAPEVRLQAVQQLDHVDDEQIDLLLSCIDSDQPSSVRGLAATAVTQLKLSPDQLFLLADALRRVGPLELARVLAVFEVSTDEELGARLFASLADSPSAYALPPGQLAALANRFGPRAVELAQPLLAAAAIDPAEQLRHLEDLLASLPDGDVRRGQLVFHQEKTACFSCHEVGYRGGDVGPDLTNIARIRSRRDLLESILYPSSSFVRSFEPRMLITVDGRQLTGVIRNETKDEITLQLSATEQRTIPTAEVEAVLPGAVSIMPTGLEQQLSRQDLADLLAYLESRK